MRLSQGWFPKEPKGRGDNDPLPEERKAKIKELEDSALAQREARMKKSRFPSEEEEEDKDKKESETTHDTKHDEIKDLRDKDADKKEDKPDDKSKDKKDDKPDEDDDSIFDDFLDDDEEDKGDDKSDVAGEDDKSGEQEENEPEGKDAIAGWRSRVQEQGKARKIAETRAIELEAERDALREQLDAETERSKTLASQNIDWNKHDTVIPMWKTFDSEVGQAAMNIDDDDLRDKFIRDSQGPLLNEYYTATKDATNLSQEITAKKEFKKILEDRYGMDNPTSAVNNLNKALTIYMGIEDATEKLKDQHANNKLSVGSSDYDAVISKYKPDIDQLGDVDDEFIETNPDAIESIVGRRYKSDDKFKKHGEKFKRRAMEFVHGLRPLTQAEMDRVEKIATSDGITLDQYMKRREENYERGRAQFINDAFHNEMAMDEYKDMRKVYDRYLKAKKKKKGAAAATSKAKSSDSSSKSDKDKEPYEHVRNIRPEGRPKGYVPASQKMRERKKS